VTESSPTHAVRSLCRINWTGWDVPDDIAGIVAGLLLGACTTGIGTAVGAGARTVGDATGGARGVTAVVVAALATVVGDGGTDVVEDQAVGAVDGTAMDGNVVIGIGGGGVIGVVEGFATVAPAVVSDATGVERASEVSTIVPVPPVSGAAAGDGSRPIDHMARRAMTQAHVVAAAARVLGRWDRQRPVRRRHRA
jgi:hypothetical protein